MPLWQDLLAGGAVLGVLGWLVVNLITRILNRIANLEKNAVTAKDTKHLEDSLTDLRTTVVAGFATMQTQHETLRRDVQDLGRYHSDRTSKLVADVHNKVEGMARDLRSEISEVRRERAGGAGD